MTKYNACTLTTSGNILTPALRLLYPYPGLFKTTQVKGEGAFKFRGNGIIPKEADLSILLAKIEEIITEELGPAGSAKRKATKHRTPILNTEEDRKFGHLADDYPVMIRPNANEDRKPGVVGPTLIAVPEDKAPDELYDGRWARFSLNVYWYKAKGGGSAGVGLGLNNVQLLDHDEPLSPGRVAPEREFEMADGLEGLE